MAQAKKLFRIAACAEGEIPPEFDRKVVDEHCEKLRPAYEKYRKGWLATAKPFLQTVVPKGLPKRVVYPFGGGDLLTVLTVFPDATDYNTISLEPPGDVRLVESIPKERLRGALRLTGYGVLKLVGVTYSNTVNLDKHGHAKLPGELMLHLAALVVHGLEPTSLRYFHVNVDGSLHYLSAEEADAEGKQRHAEKEGSRAPFSGVELRFQTPGVPGSEKVFRHFAQDLSDEELGKTPGFRAHFDSLGQVAMMTKAASHLLWADEFSIIRNYVLEHAAWMISDSTGIPPRYATAAGFVQDAYGTFDAPARYGPIEPLDAGAFRKLFQEGSRPLPMQFGYSDRHHHSHMIVMRKPSTPGQPLPAVPAPPAPSAAAAP